jgi:CBS domain-containing protein
VEVATVAQTVREVMTAEPVSMAAGFRLDDAARRMRDHNIGDVIVIDGTRVCGLVTDRDIVVRAVAEGRDPKLTKLSDICSTELVVVQPEDPLERAEQLMRDHALRRLPVVEGGRPVGIVSLGDLAVERDPTSPLAGISAAPPNA